MTPHRLAIRVYYEDTDLAGIVYYANYLRYLERGRSEALRAAGVDQGAMLAGGLAFVVRRVVADYLAPARFDDLIEVTTEVAASTGATLTMAQGVARDGRPLLRATVTLALMGADGRPRRLAPELRAALG